MKLLMCLRRVLAGFLLLGLVSCGAEPDFENRYTADAGDILRAETYGTETVEEIPAVTEPAPIVTEQKNISAVDEPDAVLSEPEDVIVLPVVVPEPPVVVPEPETEPPIVIPEPETEPPIVIPEPETPAVVVTTNIIPAGVTFVCNTNSGKYHLPDCGSVAKIKAENIAYLTCAESEIPVGYAPCSICLAASAAVQKTQLPAADPGTVTYILNTNTMKFHFLSCKSVKKIKAENYAEFSGSREDAIASGYDPCGNCKP